MNPKLKSMRALWLRCFPEDSEAFVNHFYAYYGHPCHHLTIEEGDEVIAMLHHIDTYQYVFFDKPFRTSYIYAACTAPEHQGKGLMSQLIVRTLHLLYEKRIPLCVTIPASESLFQYYGRFGFVPAFKRGCQRWDKEPLPDQPLDEMHLFDNGMDKMLQIWLGDCINNRKSGHMWHTQRDLQCALEANRLTGGFNAVLLDEHEKLAAAAVVERNDFALRVRDLVCSQPASYQNLCYLLSQATSLPVWIDTLPSSGDPYFGAARIVNMPRLLRAFAHDSRIKSEEVFYIKDDLILENNGLYRMTGNCCHFQPCPVPPEESASIKVYDIAEYSRKLFSIEPGYMTLMMD